jgi:hypothetical protein
MHLRQKPNMLRKALATERPQVFPIKQYCACFERQDVCDAFEQGGFARTVRSQDPKNLAFTH